VLYGGCSTALLANCAAPLADIWLWDGSAWTLVSPSNPGPSARAGASLVYDSTNSGRLILFGGFDGLSYHNDTWSLSLKTGTWKWSQLAPATSPSTRAYAAAGTNPSGGDLLFGGYNGTGVLGDTWQWNGFSGGATGNWSLATYQNPAPSARQLATIGYFNNPAGGTGSGLALFGGVTGAVGAGTLQSDSWIWNGTTWSLLPTSTTPSARYGAAGATDTNNGVLMFGGNTGSAVQSDTWRLS
jgi:hypothetical protein